jgi:hypothetical protein
VPKPGSKKHEIVNHAIKTTPSNSDTSFELSDEAENILREIEGTLQKTEPAIDAITPTAK